MCCGVLFGGGRAHFCFSYPAARGSKERRESRTSWKARSLSAKARRKRGKKPLKQCSLPPEQKTLSHYPPCSLQAGRHATKGWVGGWLASGKRYAPESSSQKLIPLGYASIKHSKVTVWPSWATTFGSGTLTTGRTRRREGIHKQPVSLNVSANQMKIHLPTVKASVNVTIR